MCPSDFYFLRFDRSSAQRQCPSLHFQLHFTVAPWDLKMPGDWHSVMSPAVARLFSFTFIPSHLDSLHCLLLSFPLCASGGLYLPSEHNTGVRFQSELRQNKMQNWCNLIRKNPSLSKPASLMKYDVRPDAFIQNQSCWLDISTSRRIPYFIP